MRVKLTDKNIMPETVINSVRQEFVAKYAYGKDDEKCFKTSVSNLSFIN